MSYLPLDYIYVDIKTNYKPEISNTKRIQSEFISGQIKYNTIVASEG